MLLHCREPAEGVSRQQSVQDNWSLSRRRNTHFGVSRLCRILPVIRVHIVRCDERAHVLRQKEWYHGENGSSSLLYMPDGLYERGFFC